MLARSEGKTHALMKELEEEHRSPTQARRIAELEDAVAKKQMQIFELQAANPVGQALGQQCVKAAEEKYARASAELDFARSIIRTLQQAINSLTRGDGYGG